MQNSIADSDIASPLAISLFIRFAAEWDPYTPMDMCPKLDEGTMDRGKNKGRVLASMLAAQLRIDGNSITALATTLGISQSYFSQLLSGEKPMTGVSDDVLRKCALYLRVPAVTVFLLAGRLCGADFFDEPEDLNQKLANALKIVAESQHAMDVVVSYDDLLAVTPAVQHLLVQLYEVAMGVELIPGRIGWNSLRLVAQPRVPFEVKYVRKI